MSATCSTQARLLARCAAAARATPFAAALVVTATAQVSQPEARPLQAHAAQAQIRIDYRTSAFVDQFFYVRKHGEKPELAGEDSSQKEAVAAARALQLELGSPLAWGPIEGLLGDCASAEQALAQFRALPESFELRGGKSVRLREGAVRLGEALLAAEAQFQTKIWPAHELTIADARRRIDAAFVPKEAACYARLARDLGFEGVELAIPVFLIAEGAYPGAVTQRDDAGRGVCFVSVADAAGSQLFEKILHETIHALDVASRESVLEEVRAELRSVLVKPADKEMRDVPHTLMFVEAADVIRREVDRAHVDYGEVSGVYDKLENGQTVRSYWTKHLDGVATRKLVIAAIALLCLRLPEADRSK